jgi:hypothetical protein
MGFDHFTTSIASTHHLLSKNGSSGLSSRRITNQPSPGEV